MDDPEVRALFVAEAPRGNDACRIGEGDARQRTPAAVRVLRLAWALLACLTLFAAASARAGASDDEFSDAAARDSRLADAAEGQCFALSVPRLPQLLADVESAPDLPLATSEPEATEKYARFEAIASLPAHGRTLRWFPAVRARRIASTAWVAQFARSTALPRGPPGPFT